MTRFLKFFLVMVLPFLFIETLHAKTLNIAFINGRSSQGFWGNVEDFMVEVAQDFDDVKLTIYRAESNHFEQVKILEKITSPNHKPKYDAVLTRTLKRNGIRLLEVAEKNKVPLFLFNSGLEVDQIAKIGGPRKTYKYFIGEMYPDDEAAGYGSAKELFRIAQKNKVKGKREGGRIGILALGGGPANIASKARLKGLSKYIKDNDKKLELLQVIPVFSLNDDGLNGSKIKMPFAQRRYGGISLVWGYNDAVSIGAIKSLLEGHSSDLIPDKSFFSGGIDWTPAAIEMVDSGEMAYTFGGHYMDGGWSFLVVYDYLNGKDFKDSEGVVSFFTRLSVINKENVDGFKGLTKAGKLKLIDFTKLSKFRNPAFKKYNFGLDLLLNQLQK